MRQSWLWLFTWQGRIPRLPYFLSGLFLALLKYVVDRSVALHFGEDWPLSTYVLPSQRWSIFHLGHNQPGFYLLLWTIAIPFFWVAVALTLRRLRDAGGQAAWIFLLFLPLANLALFLWLSIAPSQPSVDASDAEPDEAAAKPKPYLSVLGVVVATAIGIALVLFSTQTLAEYANGLFLGVPFVAGFIASWFLNATAVQSRALTSKVSAITVVLIGLTLIGFRYEGLICLMMAVPLAVPFAIAGGLVSREILRRCNRHTGQSTFAACVAIVPLIMLVEYCAGFEPPVTPVVSSITIDAPVSVVWKNVISFAPLEPPTLSSPGGWFFHAGIAYPKVATIVGSGAGAVRYCRFSTGDFVEPITVWDENRLLAFNVASEPPALDELSPWKIKPPHLERNYMRSLHGQFRLVALNDHQTLLEGTTWYQDYFWPQFYWQRWSDIIVHKIHMRVLDHIKTESERMSVASR